MIVQKLSKIVSRNPWKFENGSFSMAGFQTFPSHHPPPHAEPSQAIRTQLSRIERGPRRSFGMAQGRSLESQKKGAMGASYLG